MNAGLGMGGVPVERDDDPDLAGEGLDPDRVAARAILAERLERKFEEIRQSFIDEYGAVPRYIDPWGNPVFKDEATGELDQQDRHLDEPRKGEEK